MNTYFANEIENLGGDINQETIEQINKFFKDQEYQPMSESLAQATIEQLGGLDVFIDSADDIANHGANTGWSGFTYSHDIQSFYQANKDDIIKFGKSDAADVGYESLLSMVAGFNCLKSAKLSADDVADIIYASNEDAEYYTQVIDALGWYCLEHLARAYGF